MQRLSGSFDYRNRSEIGPNYLFLRLVTNRRPQKEKRRGRGKRAGKKKEKEGGGTLKENEKASKLARKGKKKYGPGGGREPAKQPAVQHSILFKLAFTAPTK